MLWEIGERGCDVRSPAVAPRPRLRLPQPAAALARGRRASSRSARASGTSGSAGRGSPRPGAAERALLDERSDELARSMLEPLSADQRDRLVDGDGRGRAAADRGAGRDRARSTRPRPRPALHERVLRRAGQPVRARVRPRHGSLPADPDEMRPPAGVFLVATLHGEPVGCGCAEVPRRRARRAEAHVGRPDRAWPRGRPPTARRARAPGRRARQPRDPARDERSASPRRSRCTARVATARSTLSTGSPTPTTGSRRTSARTRSRQIACGLSACGQ